MESPNPYLEGQFAPVQEETTTFDLSWSGNIPGHLDGRYVRIGPNPVVRPTGDYHWFLGDGMVHGLRLRDGKAEWYRNRFVRSGLVSDALGEPRRNGARAHAAMDYSPNTNVIGHAGRTLALVEAGPRPYELTEELDTVGACDFDGTLGGGYTAHPITDPVSGELHAVSYFFGWGNRVRYTVTGTDGRVKQSVDVKVHGSPMMHSFALSEKHVIFFDLPAVFSVDTATRGVPRRLRPLARISLNSFIGRHPIPEWLAAAMMRGSGSDATRAGSNPRDLPYRWDETYPARIGLMPRSDTSGNVDWYEIDPCYVFHPLNAFDRDGQVVIDVVRHPKMFATSVNGPSEGASALVRWTVDFASGKVSEDWLDDHSQEFPGIDDRLVGRPHRFGYSIGFADPFTGDTLIRNDLESGRRNTRRFGLGQTLGEFTFVAAENATPDDGFLMGYVHDVADDRSRLLIVDAETLDDVATIELPVRVPAGFHGNWISAP